MRDQGDHAALSVWHVRNADVRVGAPVQAVKRVRRHENFSTAMSQFKMDLDTAIRVREQIS